MTLRVSFTNGLRPPLTAGVSAPPPRRNQRPDGSLPGLDAGHPSNVRRRCDLKRRAINGQKRTFTEHAGALADHPRSGVTGMVKFARPLTSRTADQAQRPREVRGALRSSPDSDTDPRPHGRVEKIVAPYIETGTLVTDELADHQPHIDDYITQAQLKTRGLKRDPPPTRNPGPKL